MGIVIRFPRSASAPAAMPYIEADPAELLQMKLSEELSVDEDTGEIVRDGATIFDVATGEMVRRDAGFERISRYFRLFGLSLTGITQAYEAVALYRGVAEYNVQARLFLSNPKLFERSTRHKDEDWIAYVRAIAMGDVAATKQYADSMQLREILLQD